MSYLCQKCNKKNGGHRLRFEIKRAENNPDFEKLVLIILHGLQGFIVKISEVNQHRQTIFSHTLYKSICVTNVFTKLNPSRGI